MSQIEETWLKNGRQPCALLGFSIWELKAEAVLLHIPVTDMKEELASRLHNFYTEQFNAPSTSNSNMVVVMGPGFGGAVKGVTSRESTSRKTPAVASSHLASMLTANGTSSQPKRRQTPEKLPPVPAVSTRPQPKPPVNRKKPEQAYTVHVEKGLRCQLSTLLRQNRDPIRDISAGTGDDSKVVPPFDFSCETAIGDLPKIFIGEEDPGATALSAGTGLIKLKFPVDAEMVQKLIRLHGKCIQTPNTEKREIKILEPAIPVPTKLAKATTSILDQDIRHTWLIEASKVKFASQTWRNLFENSRKSSLLESIRRDLFPCIDAICARFDTFLAFQTGSYLAKQDQPDHLLGWVVVFPPCDGATGGELAIGFESCERRFSFDISEDDTLKCHVIAFSARCNHEFKPLSSGYRIALTYQVFCLGDAADEDPRSSQSITASASKIAECASLLKGLGPRIFLFERRIVEAFVQLFKMPRWQMRQAGIFLQHRYGNLSTLTPIRLKGIDRGVYYALLACGKFSVALVPVQVSAEGLGADNEALRTVETYYKESLRTQASVYVTVNLYDPDGSIFPRLAYNRPKQVKKRKKEVLSVEKANDDENSADTSGEKDEEDQPLPESPANSEDEDVEVRIGAKLSSFEDGRYDGKPHGPVAFVNELKDVRIGTVIGRSAFGTGSEGTEYKLQFITAAMLVSPVERNATLVTLISEPECSAKRSYEGACPPSNAPSTTEPILPNQLQSGNENSTPS